MPNTSTEYLKYIANGFHLYVQKAIAPFEKEIIWIKMPNGS